MLVLAREVRDDGGKGGRTGLAEEERSGSAVDARARRGGAG